VVFEGENSDLVGQNAIVNCVWKAWHSVQANVLLNGPASLGLFEDAFDSSICGFEELGAKAIDSALVKLRRLDQFRFCGGMVDQPHPMARRAACMTCSWVRPVAAPDDKSRSR